MDSKLVKKCRARPGEEAVAWDRFDRVRETAATTEQCVVGEDVWIERLLSGENINQ